MRGQLTSEIILREPRPDNNVTETRFLTRELNSGGWVSVELEGVDAFPSFLAPTVLRSFSTAEWES